MQHNTLCILYDFIDNICQFLENQFTGSREYFNGFTIYGRGNNLGHDQDAVNKLSAPLLREAQHKVWY